MQHYTSALFLDDPLNHRLGDEAHHAEGQRQKQHESAEGGGKEQKGSKKRHQAERADMPENESPFIMMFRAESLLSWAEYIKVNRDTDEDPDPDSDSNADADTAPGACRHVREPLTGDHCDRRQRDEPAERDRA